MNKKIKRRKIYKNYKKQDKDNFPRIKNWKKIKRYINKKSQKYQKLKKIISEKKSQVKKNSNHIKSTHNSYIKLGSIIDFEKNIDNLKEMNHNFIEARKIHKSPIRINLSKIKEISINGLIYLISHVDMLSNSKIYSKFCVKKDLKYNHKYGLNPNNEKLKFQFLKIGFWDYFQIKEPYEVKVDTENDYFLKIQTDITVKTRYVVELRNFMTNIVPFIKDDTIQEYFEDALTEVMANSVEHAYIKEVPYTKKGKWWLCGHYNKLNHCLEFSFRDYGVGLRNTLEYNTDDKLKKYVREFNYWFKSDAEIISLLVNDKVPKYKNKKDKLRGYGFKKFKEFANNIGYNCEMKILSGKGKYKYTFNADTNKGIEKLEDLDFELGGFLISWKIFINNGETK